ncbi:MAG: hypothetical protein ACW976_04295 [Candidatus Ranarchaeia archaeon]
METTALTQKPTEDLERRARNILTFLLKKKNWLSAKDINSTFGYVHSTLWKTLKYLQGEGLIRSCRSLADTRITLYKVTTGDAPVQPDTSRMRAYV